MTSFQCGPAVPPTYGPPLRSGPSIPFCTGTAPRGRNGQARVRQGPFMRSGDLRRMIYGRSAQCVALSMSFTVSRLCLTSTALTGRFSPLDCRATISSIAWLRYGEVTHWMYGQWPTTLPAINGVERGGRKSTFQRFRIALASGGAPRTTSMQPVNRPSFTGTAAAGLSVQHGVDSGFRVCGGLIANSGLSEEG